MDMDNSMVSAGWVWWVGGIREINGNGKKYNKNKIKIRYIPTLEIQKDPTIRTG